LTKDSSTSKQQILFGYSHLLLEQTHIEHWYFFRNCSGSNNSKTTKTHKRREQNFSSKGLVSGTSQVGLQRVFHSASTQSQQTTHLQPSLLFLKLLAAQKLQVATAPEIPLVCHGGRAGEFYK
jgi:hypothetical protein